MKSVKERIDEARAAMDALLDMDDYDAHAMDRALLDYAAAITAGINVDRLIVICDAEREGRLAIREREVTANGR